MDGERGGISPCSNWPSISPFGDSGATQGTELPGGSNLRLSVSEFKFLCFLELFAWHFDNRCRIWGSWIPI
jgi:hypothetical protein